MTYHHLNKSVGGGYLSPSIKISTVDVETGFAASKDFVSSGNNDIDDVTENDYGTF